MRHVPRHLVAALGRAARGFPVVVLTGPRRAGKTWLLRRHLPHADYVLLEDPDVLSRVRADPTGFLDERRAPVILDEIQNAPELLAAIRARVDGSPRRTGQWFLSGSQEFPLIAGVTESLAGRAAVLQLLPLSASESSRVTPWTGGYPEVIARPSQRELWFASYVQTYLERDVRAVTNVRDLATFRRFLALVAARHAQLLNQSDIAAPLGVSVPTVAEWLRVLEVTAQIILLPPYHANLGKRVVKTPKLYLADSGLACHLLGLRSAAELERSPFLGPILEGFVLSEIVKAQSNRGARRDVYFFRDRAGFEVDFVVPGARPTLIEVKSARSARSTDAAALTTLCTRFDKPVDAIVLHRTPRSPSPTRVVGKGVRAATIEEFVSELND